MFGLVNIETVKQNKNNFILYAFVFRIKLKLLNCYLKIVGPKNILVRIINIFALIRKCLYQILKLVFDVILKEVNLLSSWSAVDYLKRFVS